MGRLLAELVREPPPTVAGMRRHPPSTLTASTAPSSGATNWREAFNRAALELIATTTNSGRPDKLSAAANDAAAPALHKIERAAIAASTPVTYAPQELLLLIFEHLKAAGLHTSAAALAREAHLQRALQVLAGATGAVAGGGAWGAQQQQQLQPPQQQLLQPQAAGPAATAAAMPPPPAAPPRASAPSALSNLAAAGPASAGLSSSVVSSSGGLGSSSAVRARRTLGISDKLLQHASAALHTPGGAVADSGAAGTGAVAGPADPLGTQQLQQQQTSSLTSPTFNAFAVHPAAAAAAGAPASVTASTPQLQLRRSPSAPELLQHEDPSPFPFSLSMLTPMAAGSGRPATHMPLHTASVSTPNTELGPGLTLTPAAAAAGAAVASSTQRQALKRKIPPGPSGSLPLPAPPLPPSRLQHSSLCSPGSTSPPGPTPTPTPGTLAQPRVEVEVEGLDRMTPAEAVAANQAAGFGCGPPRKVARTGRRGEAAAPAPAHAPADLTPMPDTQQLPSRASAGSRDPGAALPGDGGSMTPLAFPGPGSDAEYVGRLALASLPTAPAPLSSAPPASSSLTPPHAPAAAPTSPHLAPTRYPAAAATPQPGAQAASAGAAGAAAVGCGPRAGGGGNSSYVYAHTPIPALNPLAVPTNPLLTCLPSRPVSGSLNTNWLRRTSLAVPVAGASTSTSTPALPGSGSGSGSGTAPPPAAASTPAAAGFADSDADCAAAANNNNNQRAAPLVPEPTDLPGHVEAATRDVLAACGPPVNSKLHSIVTSYLRQAHRQACLQSAHPIATLPPIPLSRPYSLPQATRAIDAPSNLTGRMMRREVYGHEGGRGGVRAQRHLLHSRFKLWRSMRDDSSLATCCAFMFGQELLLVGTQAGELRVHDVVSGGWGGAGWGGAGA